MSAGRYDLLVEQGATFDRLLTWTADGVPVSLAGKSARLHVRAAPGVPDPPLLSLASPDQGIVLTDPGSIKISLTSTQTAALSFDWAVYDLEVVDPSTTPPTVTRLLEGRVVLSPEVTR